MHRCERPLTDGPGPAPSPGGGVGRPAFGGRPSPEISPCRRPRRPARPFPPAPVTAGEGAVPADGGHRHCTDGAAPGERNDRLLAGLYVASGSGPPAEVAPLLAAFDGRRVVSPSRFSLCVGPGPYLGHAMEDALQRARKACRPDVVEFDDDEEGQGRPAPGTHQPSRGLAQQVIVRLGQRCLGAPGGAGCARRRRGSGAHRAGLTRTASRAGGLGFVGPGQCLCGPRLGLGVVVPQGGEHDRWSHPGSPEPRHTMPLRLDRLRAGVDNGSADGYCRSGWVGP